MNPRLYVGTGGFSVWFSNDLGETFERFWGTSGLYSESRVWALQSHPRRPTEILAGTDSGLYRLDVFQSRWTRVPSPMDDLEVWYIAFSPRDPDLLLCGTRPAALFRSEDGGATWQKAQAGFPDTCPFVLVPRVTKIQFDPENPDLVWAGLEVGGVWRSHDAGRSWRQTSSGLVSEDVHDVGLVRNGGRTLLAATNQGLHRSSDDGESWELAPIESDSQYTRTVVPRADGSGVVFLGNGDGPPGSWGRLQRSRDFGQHWEDARLPGKVQSTAWQVAVNPDDPNLIFVASALGQYYRSTDGGDSWVELPRRLTETRALKWISVPLDEQRDPL